MWQGNTMRNILSLKQKKKHVIIMCICSVYFKSSETSLDAVYHQWGVFILLVISAADDGLGAQ